MESTSFEHNGKTYAAKFRRDGIEIIDEHGPWPQRLMWSELYSLLNIKNDCSNNEEYRNRVIANLKRSQKKTRGSQVSA